uniref:Uncharacterized protein n=1 Tax=Magallana gigas TaxID=29159 RepID=A0A8W8KQL3_MAGGI
MAYKSTDATADIKATSTANSAMGSTTLVTVHTTSSCHCNATVEPVSKAMTSTTTLVAVSTITSPATMATTSSTTVEDHTVSSLHCDSGTSLQDNNGHYKLLLHKRLCLRWPTTCIPRVSFDQTGDDQNDKRGQVMEAEGDASHPVIEESVSIQEADEASVASQMSTKSFGHEVLGGADDVSSSNIEVTGQDEIKNTNPSDNSENMSSKETKSERRIVD